MPTDPDSVETCSCATDAKYHVYPDCVRNRNRTCKAVHRIVCCVQCSLPCVGMRGLGSEAFGAVAAADERYCPLKPCLQKRIEPANDVVEIT